jgi:hypothetical protein
MTDPIDNELADLVRNIDASPDRLHFDVTPAVLQLTELGLPAAKAVLELLNAPDVLTRQRAQRVVEGIVMRRHGWQPGQGYPEPHGGQQRVKSVIESNGSYRADAPPEFRRQAIAKWRQWIESEEHADQMEE